MSRFQRALRAWHGSPYDFQEFQDSAIGSGEGAQIYGHGHYVAEARPVAEGYRDQITRVRKSLNENPHWTYKGTPISDIVKTYPHGPGAPEWTIEQRALGSLSNYDVYNKPRGFQTTIKKMRDTAKFYADRYSSSHGEAVKHDSIADWMEENKQHFQYNKNPESRDLGRLYEVHVALGDHELLDWDRPLRLHHPEAQERLKSIVGQILSGTDSDSYNPYLRAFGDHAKNIKDRTGNDLYQIARDMLGSPSEASRALLNAGIRGIRYRDQQSRTPSTNLHLDGEKIEPFDGTKEHHLHRRELDPDWDIASNIAFGLKADGGNNTDLDKLIAHYKETGDRQVKLGITNTPFSHKAMNWLEQNRHRVQLKRDRGTYNYVVFDPKDIKIVRKYGLKNQLLKDFGEGAVHLTNVEGDNQHG